MLKIEIRSEVVITSVADAEDSGKVIITRVSDAEDRDRVRGRNHFSS